MGKYFDIRSRINILLKAAIPPSKGWFDQFRFKARTGRIPIRMSQPHQRCLIAWWTATHHKPHRLIRLDTEMVAITNYVHCNSIKWRAKSPQYNYCDKRNLKTFGSTSVWSRVAVERQNEWCMIWWSVLFQHLSSNDVFFITHRPQSQAHKCDQYKNAP